MAGERREPEADRGEIARARRAGVHEVGVGGGAGTPVGSEGCLVAVNAG